MRMRRLLAAVLGLAVAAAPVAAQDAVPGQAAAPPAAPAAQGAIDAHSLGVSFDRIHRRLAADSRARSNGESPIKLEFHVDVYGTAPALRFFAGQNLAYGGVPHSAPTHGDMLQMFTPQEFRAPVVDFFGLAMSAATAAARKMQDWQYQRDLKEYQKWVEAGRNLPAPKPPREQ
jgi:hypothetical protein